MSEVKKRRRNREREEALKRSDQCIYCGEKADSVDHFPPRSFFREGQWPKNYAFPACMACNNGKGEDEQVIGKFLKMQNLDPVKDPDFQKFVDGVRMSRPDLFEKIKVIEGEEAKRALRELAGNDESAAKLAIDGAKVIDFPASLNNFLTNFSGWLGRSLYFQHVGRIHLGEVFTRIFTLQAFERPELRRSLDLHIQRPTIARGKDLSKQFYYRYLVMDRTFSGFIWFGNPQFIFSIVASQNPTVLELNRQFERGGFCIRIPPVKKKGHEGC
ncbi:hypothetical protein N5W20_04600 [Candidatus Kirkpatrickella diaphorinae]|uniref:HNH endonuclease n=1 Tax=Candidatus Kirkpatrickella diaphorinae TaxID=2984322 RepID=A0ABY6GMN8_9PROT|nr:hypothetical protein [Candidatus Kirkpatrickella diaphorinae]UYH52138.1 hypothetical protein N5W20_04600 [Candidatus Kirkpatrickella diaphorinae]